MNKKQNIVFILGAGFSAHYIIPVMGNFISKAKDLYFSIAETKKNVFAV